MKEYRHHPMRNYYGYISSVWFDTELETEVCMFHVPGVSSHIFPVSSLEKTSKWRVVAETIKQFYWAIKEIL
jgi:hypothetical protein